MTPFKSFWMGGFEGADHLNEAQKSLDMVRDSGHLENVDQNYSRLAQMGVKTVRESIGWRTSQPTSIDKVNLERAHHFAQAARRHDIQIIWTFMHYGIPYGLSLKRDDFIDRFRDFARQVAMELKQYDDKPIFNLINEISFLSWATSQTNQIFPYIGTGDPADGYDVKKRLVRAVLEAMAAVKCSIPGARFLHVEPLLNIVAPIDRPDLEPLAQEVRSHQWQTWEMLKGNLEPQLGGHPEALDIMGVNYYYNGQMEVHTDKTLQWEDPPDPRRVRVGELLAEVHERYGRPFIISETGHFDDARPAWLEYVMSETQATLEKGIPLLGVCIYPVVDRPCWNTPDKLIECGLLGHFGSLKTFRRWQKKIQ